MSSAMLKATYPGDAGNTHDPQHDQHFDGEQVAAYVSRLKGRRLEEDASRKMRTQRRADTVNANMEAFRKRGVAQRRRLMNEKIQMTSQIERNLFSMLDEQSKWRHVMYQNVVEQEQHLSEMVGQQNQLDTTYLKGLQREENEVFTEMVDDDQCRWKTLHEHKKNERETEVWNICSEVLADAQGLAEKVIDFDDINGLSTDPVLPPSTTGGTVSNAAASPIAPSATVPIPSSEEGETSRPSMFNRVPRIVFSEWVRGVIYPTKEKSEKKVLEDHVSLRVCRLAEGTTGDGSVDNALFGALTNKLQQIHFPPPAPFHPVNAMPKAIIVMNGPKYVGKSSVGKQTAAQLNLQYLSDTDMVQLALDEIEREVNPADLADEQEAIRAELLDLGVEIRRAILDGQEVGDSIMAKLVLNRIRAVASSDYVGLLLDGSPSNRAVFEQVEASLCQYDSNRRETLPEKVLAPLQPIMPEPSDPMFTVERPPTPPPVETKEQKKSEGQKAKKDKKKDEPEEPLPPLDLPVVEPVPPLTEEQLNLVQSVEPKGDKFGTHAVIQLHCPPDELFKRYSGIRVDVDNNTPYHLTSNPPPLEKMSRIAVTDRSEGDAVNLHAVIAENGTNSVMNWLDRFTTVATVNAQKPLAEITRTVTSIAESTIASVDREFEIRSAAEELLSQRKEMEELFVERTATREAMRKHLAGIYTERGVDPLPAELLEPLPVKPVNESRALPVPANLPAVYLQILDDFTEYYTHSLYGVHGEMTKMVDAVYAEGRYCMSQFDKLWKNPDTKQPLINAFCEEFNEMVPALRRDVQGKEELHLRVDSLCESLWHLAEKRRDDASAVIEQLLNRSAFIDMWCDAVRMLGGSLIQLELERFFVVKQLSVLYFNGLKMEVVVLDDSDLVHDIIPVPRGPGEASSPVETQPKGKEKGKPPPKKPAGKAPPQPVDSRPSTAVDEQTGEVKIEDHFPGVVDKAVGVMRQTIDRLNGPATPAPGQTKEKKKALADTVTTPDIPTTGSLASPLVQAELELAKKRMEAISKYVHTVIDEGFRRCSAVLRAKMQAKLRKHFVEEMGAINGAVYNIRTSIEEERPIQYAMVLDGPTYAVDYGRPLVPRTNARVPITAIHPTISMPTAEEAEAGWGAPIQAASSSGEFDENAGLTRSLTVTRAKELLEIFRKIAPDFLVYKEDFVTIVRKEDYSCATPVPSVDTIFDRFDLLGCGAIDWREFLVHILFFCEPQFLEEEEGEAQTPTAFGGSAQPRNDYFVETPSLYQLFDFRNDLGSDLLQRDEYDEIPFFFETQMEEERLEQYRDLLWNIFSRPPTEEEHSMGGVPLNARVLDSNVMVMFFCADDQPLRGIQKAFAMAASVADENCSLTVEQLNYVFHFNACDATKLNMDDPYDGETILSVFKLQGNDAETLNFQEACSTQNGRMLFNNANLYQKRSFLAPPEEAPAEGSVESPSVSGQEGSVEGEP